MGTQIKRIENSMGKRAREGRACTVEKTRWGSRKITGCFGEKIAKCLRKIIGGQLEKRTRKPRCLGTKRARQQKRLGTKRTSEQKHLGTKTGEWETSLGTKLGKLNERKWTRARKERGARKQIEDVIL